MPPRKKRMQKEMASLGVDPNLVLDMPKTKRGGKQKIDIKFVENPTKRKSTFNKRSKGLLKKASEIAILCEGEIDLMFRNPEDGQVYHFTNLQDLDTFHREMRLLSRLDRKGLYKKFNEEHYNKGLCDLQTLPAGIRPRLKAGRKKKCTTVEPSKNEEQELALPDEQRQLNRILEDIKTKKYPTTTMTKQGTVFKSKYEKSNGEKTLHGFVRIEAPGFGQQEMYQLNALDNRFETMSVQDTIRQDGDDVVVTRSVNMTVEERIKSANAALSRIRSAIHNPPNVQIEEVHEQSPIDPMGIQPYQNHYEMFQENSGRTDSDAYQDYNNLNFFPTDDNSIYWFTNTDLSNLDFEALGTFGTGNSELLAL